MAGTRSSSRYGCAGPRLTTGEWRVVMIRERDKSMRTDLQWVDTSVTCTRCAPFILLSPGSEMANSRSATSGVGFDGRFWTGKLEPAGVCHGC